MEELLLFVALEGRTDIIMSGQEYLGTDLPQLSKWDITQIFNATFICNMNWPEDGRQKIKSTTFGELDTVCSLFRLE